MTEKIKSEEKRSSPKKNNNNFIRNFALTLGLILAAIIFLVKYNPELLDSFLKGKSSPVKQPVEQIDKDKSAPEESYSVGPKPPLLSFAPESELDSDDEDLEIEEDVEPEAQHPYEIEIEKDELVEQGADSPENRARLVSELNNYRLFLANADELVAKFKQDKVFYNELKVFNSIAHPDMIKNTLFLLEDYNKMLSNPECETTDKFVEIFSSKPWNKFIKVTKISKASEDQKQLKDGISANLAVFINYIYSAQLQESFIK